MITIGIIGANGQVGIETCLYLSQIENIQVIPICRTEFGSAFLDLCRIKCRIGNISDPQIAKSLLKDCDLIADFTYIKGLPSEIKSISENIILNTIKFSPPDAKFVYASSIMAYGMGKNNPDFKDYLFARSVYGAMKRYSEKLALQAGKKLKKEVYILRIGQVHGELQSVSRKYLKEIRDEVAIIPDAPSYTVFPYTIAEALVNIAKGKEKPGLYTLVSKPEWSWKEVHEYYCNNAGIKPNVTLIENTQPSFFINLKHTLGKLIFKIATYYNEAIASYLLIHFPKLEQRLMALYYIQKAKSQIKEGKRSNTYNPFSNIHSGKILGKRLVSLSDSRISMQSLSLKIKNLIYNI